ncbi:hypothetical protein B296_00039484 [Ensete ventricosum]|uniref:Chlorophyll a-b binding protein, chloroplastic n=1 Tax=Ensete ventricosum TaxID=4639 RepID=A0A426XVD8_ENSVE|nr:hypothetical protein B296_00039484 [Ensete ventricosum]
MAFAVSTTVAGINAGEAPHAFTTSSLNFPAGGRKRGPFHPTFSSRPPPRPVATRLLARAQLQRATWLPGLDPPPHLDGTLAGDFGFDPLGLGEDPQSLKWYVQAELVHCRFAMAGVAGILVTDVCYLPPAPVHFRLFRCSMVAMVGFFVQANVTHAGPIDNLTLHLADPFKNTIIHNVFDAAS